MHSNEQRFELVKSKINEICKERQLKTIPQIIAVSKTFALKDIIPLIEVGHLHFGENKLQEAESKWQNIKFKNRNLKLHMLGKLQSNKAKKAVLLFDYIHSLDNTKLATKINQYQKEFKKNVKLFIQVNLADESQKSGIPLNNLNSFYNFCVNELSLNIIGLMCLPPINSDCDNYFKMLNKAAKDLNLNHLSMGMSANYKEAILNGSTYLRLGTIIFGTRKS